MGGLLNPLLPFMGDECAICYSAHEQVETGFFTCRHAWNRVCVSKWLAAGHGCPLCRAAPNTPISSRYYSHYIHYPDALLTLRHRLERLEMMRNQFKETLTLYRTWHLTLENAPAEVGACETTCDRDLCYYGHRIDALRSLLVDVQHNASISQKPSFVISATSKPENILLRDLAITEKLTDELATRFGHFHFLLRTVR